VSRRVRSAVQASQGLARETREVAGSARMTGSRVRKLGAFGAGLAALGTLGMVGPAARAQPAGAGARAEGARTIHLAYRAPPTCPDEAALVARIRARVDVRTGPESDGVPSSG